MFTIFDGFSACLYMFFFAAMGAAYGTAKSGTGIAAMAVMRPEAIMKSIIPVSTLVSNRYISSRIRDSEIFLVLEH